MQERNYMLIATNCVSDFRHGAEKSELVLDRGGRSQSSSLTSRIVSRAETRSGGTSGTGTAAAAHDLLVLPSTQLQITRRYPHLSCLQYVLSFNHFVNNIYKVCIYIY